jgi:hypothetical protein
MRRKWSTFSRQLRVEIVVFEALGDEHIRESEALQPFNEPK